ncbi:MAG: hypothetical protein ACT6FD_06915 [Methanosarcinaceae archaeon]
MGILIFVKSLIVRAVVCCSNRKTVHSLRRSNRGSRRIGVSISVSDSGHQLR